MCVAGSPCESTSSGGPGSEMSSRAETLGGESRVLEASDGGSGVESPLWTGALDSSDKERTGGFCGDKALLRHDATGSHIEERKPTRPRRAVTEDEDSKRDRDPTLSHQETPLGNHCPQKPWRTTELRRQANMAWICVHTQLRTLLPGPENFRP